MAERERVNEERERCTRHQSSGSEELNVIFWLFQGCQDPQNTPLDFVQMHHVRLLSLCVCSSAPPAVKQSQTCSCLCIRDREQRDGDNNSPRVAVFLYCPRNGPYAVIGSGLHTRALRWRVLLHPASPEFLTITTSSCVLCGPLPAVPWMCASTPAPTRKHP